MDRLTGAAEAVTFIRALTRFIITPPAGSFDVAFSTSAEADHD